ncbi:hypothetical protein P4129_27220 [Pseudomonas aeruginosa]|nr:hypothetical protein [Pseudomonas aeruginosa]
MAGGLAYALDSAGVAGAVALLRVLSPMTPDDGQVQHAATLATSRVSSQSAKLLRSVVSASATSTADRRITIKPCTWLALLACCQRL